MAEPFSNQLIQAINTVNGLYYRLVLLVGSSNTGKTTAMRGLSSSMNITLTNVNLELSKSLLEMTPRQRTLQVPTLLDQIAIQAGDVALFDNTEVLFDVQIKQDPLRLFQRLSRNRTVVATWNGTVKEGKLYYAEPGHPEYRCYDVDDIVYISTSGNDVLF